MTPLEKVAEHVSHAFCAVIVGVWLGAAFEVIDGRADARHAQEQKDLTHLIERTIPEASGLR